MTTTISQTAFYASTIGGTTAHVWNRVLPETLPTKTRGNAMTRPQWEKRVATALLKYARLYAKVYQHDYECDTNGAEDYVPEGWDTSIAIAQRGCELAVEENIFDDIVTIAFAAITDTGWRKSYEGERWARTLTYVGKDAAWLKAECDRLYYRAPGFWADDAQVESDGEVTTVTLVSHNEGEL